MHDHHTITKASETLLIAAACLAVSNAEGDLPLLAHHLAHVAKQIEAGEAPAGAVRSWAMPDTAPRVRLPDDLVPWPLLTNIALSKAHETLDGLLRLMTDQLAEITRAAMRDLRALGQRLSEVPPVRHAVALHVLSGRVSRGLPEVVAV